MSSLYVTTLITPITLITLIRRYSPVPPVSAWGKPKPRPLRSPSPSHKTAHPSNPSRAKSAILPISISSFATSKHLKKVEPSSSSLSSSSDPDAAPSSGDSTPLSRPTRLDHPDDSHSSQPAHKSDPGSNTLTPMNAQAGTGGSKLQARDWDNGSQVHAAGAIGGHLEKKSKVSKHDLNQSDNITHSSSNHVHRNDANSPSAVSTPELTGAQDSDPAGRRTSNQISPLVLVRPKMSGLNKRPNDPEPRSINSSTN